MRRLFNAQSLWENLHWLHGHSSLFQFVWDDWRGVNGHCKLEPLSCFFLLMTWLKELLATNCLEKLWRKIPLVVLMALVSNCLCALTVRQTSSLCQPFCHHCSLLYCTARREQSPSSRISSSSAFGGTLGTGNCSCHCLLGTSVGYFADVWVLGCFHFPLLQSWRFLRVNIALALTVYWSLTWGNDIYLWSLHPRS